MSFFSNRRQSDPTDEPEAIARPTVAPSIGFETVLGGNSTLEGVLTSSGNVRLDGTFSGTLNITGNVLIGETAKIHADVDARNISIAGAVRGNVTGNKVQILRTGRVWGDIRATALTTEEGAFIDGRITMKGHTAASKTPPDLPETKPTAKTEPSKADTAEAPQLPAPAKPDTPQEDRTQEARVDLDPTLLAPPFPRKADND
jgi:cytoskeletal protein CcmA (bactofilin family)